MTGATVHRAEPGELLDLLVVGAGPTGIAIGAEAVERDLSVVLVERGSLTENVRRFPTDMVFFTTRERLEIADTPFAIPDVKPTRVQALAYYREVARRFALPLALHEEVVSVERCDEGFRAHTVQRGRERSWACRAVALASGYFGRPRKLGVAGESLPWVHARYSDPYGHFGEQVAVIGGGNSAVETALDLLRWGAEVTLVHRGENVKPSVKYWLRPDVENRIADGEIRALFQHRVTSFGDGAVEVEGPAGPGRLAVDAAYVLIGYIPELDLASGCGVEIDPESGVPTFHPESGETNVPGFYVAGTLQAGYRTDRIFIENSRDHGRRIVAHLAGRLRPRG